MKQHYIDIDESWGIIFCYDFDWFDADSIDSLLYTFGCSEKDIKDAIKVLMGLNTGLTVSRSDITMSLVFISNATSKKQWLDTLAHEIDHVQFSICMHYGVQQGSEEAAWLQGYIMRQITEVLEHDDFL